MYEMPSTSNPAMNGGWDAPFGLSILIDGRCDATRMDVLVHEVAGSAPDRPLEIIFLSNLAEAERKAAEQAARDSQRDVRFAADLIETSAPLDARWRVAARIARGNWICTLDVASDRPVEQIHELLEATRADVPDVPAGQLEPAPLVRREHVVGREPVGPLVSEAPRRGDGVDPDARATRVRGHFSRPAAFAALSSMALDLVCFGALLTVGIHYLAAAAIATQAAIVWLFLVSDRWVHAGTQSYRKRPNRFTAFLTMNEAVLLVRIPMLLALVEALSLDAVAANVLTLVALAIARALVSDDWIWSPLARPPAIPRIST